MPHIDPSIYKLINANDEVWIPEGYQPTKDDLNKCKQIKEYIQDFRTGNPTNDDVADFIKHLGFQLRLKRIWRHCKNDNIIRINDNIFQIIDKNVFKPIYYEYTTISLIESMIINMDRVIVKLNEMYKKHLKSLLNNSYSLKYVDQNDLNDLQRYKELTESMCKESAYVDTDAVSKEKPLQIICIPAEDSERLDFIIYNLDGIIASKDSCPGFQRYSKRIFGDLYCAIFNTPFGSEEFKNNYIIPMLNHVDIHGNTQSFFKSLQETINGFKELREKWIVIKDPKLQKGTDTVMGVNIKDNTSEGKSFENAFKFDKKDKEFEEQIKKPVESNGEWQSYIDNQIVPTCKSTWKRPSKVEYYLGIAEACSRRSTCLRIRYGSVIVKNDRIVSTGYNGSPKGTPNCCDIGECPRKTQNIPHGTRYETCASCHSEMNAIITGTYSDMIGATLYLSGVDIDSGEFVDADCCMMCKRAVINAGIETVIFRTKNGGVREAKVSEWVNDDSVDRFVK